jgi:hypothetical protein
MPMTFDLNDIETELREPALRDLLGQIPVPIDLWPRRPRAPR